MDRYLSSNTDFIAAFVETCYAQGFNEKQASALLDTYIKVELCKSDPDFVAGIQEEFNKSATAWHHLKGLGKAMFSGASRHPGLSTALAGGAAAGAMAPEGWAPDNYAGGAGIGALGGSVLGALATRGRGLGSSLGNIGKAITQGGLGRTVIGEGAKLISNPKVLRNTGLGVAAGLSSVGADKFMDAGLQIGGFNLFGRKPAIPVSAGAPSYYSGGGVNPAGQGMSDPFQLPSEVFSRSGGSAAVGGLAAGEAVIQNKRNEIVSLNQQIQQIEASMPLGNNPSSFAQRQALQAEADNLKMRRNLMNKEIFNLENSINQDKYRMIDTAAQQTELASRGLSSAQNEFETLRRRQSMENQGGIMGPLTKLYNMISGAKGRLAELDPIYSGYQQQLDEANKLRQLAN